MSKPVIAATPGEAPRTDLTEPIAVRQKAMIGWKGIATAFVIAGFGALVWWSTVSTDPLGAYAYGAIFIGGAALGLWNGIKDAIWRPIALLISSDGITVLGRDSTDLVRWSDIRGAHTATIGSGRVSFEIVALQLVDPRSFYARLESSKRRWLRRDAGTHPTYYPIFSGELDIVRLNLVALIDDGIRRWGMANPDPRPERSYWLVFNRLPFRVPSAVGVILIVALLTAPFILLAAPRWVNAGNHCDVRNPYSGKQWRRAKLTATWSGPCVDGRAQGSGVLEWFSEGRLSVRYSGQMENGRVTGRGEWIENGARYDGVWNDGELREGVATYPDGRRYSGRWGRGRWIRGVLTAPGGYSLEERWYEGQLTGKGIARGPQGQYEGNWTEGVPEGSGVFVTHDGRRFEGKWRHGKPVDPEVAQLQAQEKWDCLWDAASRRFGDGFAYVGTARCRNQ
ncbi:MAG: junctophilin-4-like [Rhodospirillaceae bacterium]|nr:MAG: junctophilin-4-like [Rhodospirillaceae bacterium]